MRMTLMLLRAGLLDMILGVCLSYDVAVGDELGEKFLT